VSSPSHAALPTAPDDAAPEELSLLRVNLLRVGYLLLGLGLAVVKWPLLLEAGSQPLYEGVVTCLLTALSLFAFLGLRYPVALLPVLVFECAWKLIWLSVVALPAFLAGDVDDGTAGVIFSCSVVVVILLVIPWRYVWRRYATAPGDRWR
jgi:hypothetical protein